MKVLHKVSMKTTQFQFDKKHGTLVAEASELGIRAGDCLRSILLYSPHTGRTALFEYDEQAAIDAEFWDGEMAEYLSKDEFAKSLKVVVLND